MVLLLLIVVFSHQNARYFQRLAFLNTQYEVQLDEDKHGSRLLVLQAPNPEPPPHPDLPMDQTMNYCLVNHHRRSMVRDYLHSHDKIDLKVNLLLSLSLSLHPLNDTSLHQWLQTFCWYSSDQILYRECPNAWNLNF